MNRLLAMRWWLALAFASVAAFTAIGVVAVLGTRADRAFRDYAEEFVIGNAVAAAESLRHDRSVPLLRADTEALVGRRHVALFVFDGAGRLLTPGVSFGVPWSRVPRGREAVRSALAGVRYLNGRGDGSEYVVGLPIRGGVGSVLVVYSLRPELRVEIGIVHTETLQAALVAMLAGAALGLLVATLIAHRLRRIAAAAHAIGAGDFEVPVHDGFPDEVGSVARSIERMRTQLQALFLALEGDRSRLEQLLDRLNEGVLLVDRDLKVEFANDRARELLRIDGTLDPAPAALSAFARGLFDATPPTLLRLADDDQTLLVSGVPPGPGGDNAIVVVADETLRERQELAQREFATNAAHELRTPLASIVTAVELLQTGAKDDPEARDEFLAMIALEADRLTRLTRALLVLARAEAQEQPPRHTPFALEPVLRQVAAGRPPGEPVPVAVDCPAGLTVTGDRDLLEQALWSLVANAVEHTPTGSVTLRARREAPDRIVVEVVDTGSGIDAHEQRRVFERFYRAGDRAGGFGLGLSIARQAVRNLGGEITLESEPGVGTIVRIVLPAPE